MQESLVALLMGSDSDLAVMSGASEVLERFGVDHEVHIMSAHRTPERVAGFVGDAAQRGVRVFICGAGMAAHLAGIVAAHTMAPVIGVPLSGGGLGGRDALYSTVQMPTGVPVATVAIDGARNAGYLAVRILACADARLASLVEDHRQQMAAEVVGKDERLQSIGVEAYLNESRSQP